MSLSEDEIINAAERVKPSVVAIYSIRYVRDIFSYITPVKGFGSGFIVREDGYILTNAHVVEGASKVNVALGDRSVAGFVVGRDRSSDVAVVKIEVEGLPSVKLGNSDEIRVGQIVLALGNPLALTGEPTVTMGVISAVRKLIKTNRRIFENLIQTDAAINPGNSGGPLINLRGEAIGMNTAIIPYAQGIGFAIPINIAKRVIEDIVAYGRVVKPWIGIYCIPLNRSLATYYKLPTDRGCLVVETVPGGPADKAGVRSGDIITAVDGRGISQVEELTFEVSRRRAGEIVELSIVRGYSERKVGVKLEMSPDTR